MFALLCGRGDAGGEQLVPPPAVVPLAAVVQPPVVAVPLPVVRGLQLGLGLKVVGAGISLGTRTRMWLDTSTNLDGYVMGSLALLVALLTYGQRRLPAWSAGARLDSAHGW